MLRPRLHCPAHLHAPRTPGGCPIINNPIVDEVHRIREQLLAQYNGDFDAFVKDLQRRTEEAARAGRTVLPLPPDPRTATPADPTKKAG